MKHEVANLASQVTDQLQSNFIMQGSCQCKTGYGYYKQFPSSPCRPCPVRCILCWALRTLTPANIMSFFIVNRCQQQSQLCLMLTFAVDCLQPGYYKPTPGFYGCRKVQAIECHASSTRTAPLSLAACVSVIACCAVSPALLTVLCAWSTIDTLDH